jgi:hypothetical protein
MIRSCETLLQLGWYIPGRLSQTSRGQGKAVVVTDSQNRSPEDQTWSRPNLIEKMGSESEQAKLVELRVTCPVV